MQENEGRRQAQLDYLSGIFGPMRVGTPQQQYDATLNAIRQGFTFFESRAKELCEKYGIDMTGLPEVVTCGERRLLRMYVDAIAEKGGHSALESNAEKLARKLGYNLNELVEDAIINNSGPI